MARLFTAASSHFLENATVPITGVPLTLACWIRPDTVAAGTAQALYLGDSGSSNNYFSIGRSAASLKFNVRDATVSDAMGAGTDFAANTWYHIAGVAASTTSRVSYLNGAVQDTSAAGAITPASVDRINVGRLGRSVPTDYWSGSIAEAAIWSVDLTLQEIAALAAGASPAQIRPDSLVFYAPIWGLDSPEPDLTTGHRNLTLGNAPTFTAGPPTQPFLYVPQEWTALASAAAPAALASRRALLGVGV